MSEIERRRRGDGSVTEYRLADGSTRWAIWWREPVDPSDPRGPRVCLPTDRWDDVFVNDFGEREDLYGFEWDFLALDRDGSIAVLTTAGEGAIPPAVVRERALVELAVGALGKLASRCESIDLRSQDRLSGNYSDWFELSRRGLFTYDWNLLRDGPYEPVSAPTVPMRIGDVDPAIAKAAALHRVLSSFSEAVQIRIGEPGR